LLFDEFLVYLNNSPYASFMVIRQLAEYLGSILDKPETYKLRNMS